MQAFAQTKGLFGTITGDDIPANSPGRLGNDPTNEERAAHRAAGAAYKRALDDIKKRKTPCGATWLRYWIQLARL